MLNKQVIGVAVALLLIQAAVIIGTNGYVFAGGKVFSSVIITDLLHSRFVPEFLQFLLVSLLLCIIAALYIVRLQAWLLSRIQTGKFISLLLSFTLALSVLLVINRSLFPHSVFQAPLVLNGIWLTTAVIFLVTMMCLLRPKLSLTLLLVVAADQGTGLWLASDINEPKWPAERNNIVIISIDSLRPDILNTVNPEQSPAPFISTQVARSRWYPNTYTPLARTFPSWMSVLTGRPPSQNGAQFNLTAINRQKLGQTLADQLHSAGYQTIFATDERRFANITPAHGFDQIWGPHYGVADFILGHFGDLPLNNLFTRLNSSRWLLPYSTLNRAAYVTYRPEQFSRYLRQEINQLNQQQNLFLAVHFCLPHHPFMWQDSDHSAEQPDAYDASVRVADRQAADLYRFLQERRMITAGTLVIFMSDHGEALPQDPRSLTTRDGKIISLAQSGHGTDPQQLTQSRVLLAIQSAGIRPETNQRLTSLMDIYPTVLQWVSGKAAPVPENCTHGNCGLPLSFSLSQRLLSLESGYNISTTTNTPLTEKEALSKGTGVYRITPAGHLVISEQDYPQLLQLKQSVFWDGQTFYFPDHNMMQTAFYPVAELPVPRPD